MIILKKHAMDDSMKKIGFVAGLLMAVGGAGGITELPASATLLDWTLVLSLTIAGCIVVYICSKGE